jgi:hypothetical protein
MNRFEFVLANVENPADIDIAVLATEFKTAIDTAAVEGYPPEMDPAVIVLGSWIAFRVGADINTVHGYRLLLDACQLRFDTQPSLQ